MPSTFIVIGQEFGFFKKENVDLVRFVNGVLDDIRADGTWERLYQAHLQPLGPSPGPPIPRYQD